MRCLRLAVFSLAFLTPAWGWAHLELKQPQARYGKYVLKAPPCGKGGGGRTQKVSTFTAGETITVVWDEYVNHPGHYRIAFDEDGTDGFKDPKCVSGCKSYSPKFAMKGGPGVLKDGITDKFGGTYTQKVTLPNVTCDNCTLQVIQVMYDKPPYSIPGNDIYYQCADLKLVAPSKSDAGDAGKPADVSDAGVIGDTGPAEDTDASGDSDAGDTSRDSAGPVSDAASDTGDTASASSDARAETGVDTRRSNDVISTHGHDSYSNGPSTPSGGGGDDGGCTAGGPGGPSPDPLPVAVFGAILLISRRRYSA